jgi:hypothetical protein
MKRTCPHCGQPAPVGCITCTASECQEKEYHASRARNASPRQRVRTLDRIAALMSGTTWSADTLDAIARELRAAGYRLEEPRG